MFNITLFPFRDFAGLGPLTLAKSGSVLTINGDDLDLSGVLPGQTLPADAVTGLEWLRSDIVNIDSVFHLTLGFPLGPIPYPAPPEAWAVTHPDPITVTEDGPIDLPTYTEAAEEEGDA